MVAATEDDDLAAAVHRMLATLTDLRSAATSPDVLLSRIALVRRLRKELGEVESLLTGAARRAPGATWTATRVDGR